MARASSTRWRGCRAAIASSSSTLWPVARVARVGQLDFDPRELGTGLAELGREGFAARPGIRELVGCRLALVARSGQVRGQALHLASRAVEFGTVAGRRRSGIA